MQASLEHDWTLIAPNSTTPPNSTMSSTNDTIPTPAAEPKLEAPTDTDTKRTITTEVPAAHKDDDTSEPGMPKLERQTSFDSFISIDDYRRSRRPIRNTNPVYIRPYTPSPPPRRRGVPIVQTISPIFTKSGHFLESVNKFDGTVELPRPSRGYIYLTTFPFTDAHVKKWAWLFSLNVEEVFLEEDTRPRGGRDVDFGGKGETLVYPTARTAYNDDFIHPLTVDIPSVYLSRSLDAEVVPEDAVGVKYLIVTQNRHRPAGCKLLVAESRKAAGIMMFYEALKGDSVVFVGAAVDMVEKRVHPKKFVRVESLEQARGLGVEGMVGIVC